MDISSAFTNGELEEVLYMRQPEGFHEGGPNRVCRLKKSLYGLKQAARQWNKKLHTIFVDLGFKRLQSDHSLYIYAKNEVTLGAQPHISIVFPTINIMEICCEGRKNMFHICLIFLGRIMWEIQRKYEIVFVKHICHVFATYFQG